MSTAAALNKLPSALRAALPAASLASPAVRASIVSSLPARSAKFVLSSSTPAAAAASTLVRPFSSRSNSAAVDNFIKDRRTSARSDLRIHAVSILDGNYDDYDDDEDGEEKPFPPEYDDMDDDGWSLTPADALAAKALVDKDDGNDDDDGDDDREFGLQIGSGTSEEDIRLQAEALKQQQEYDAQRKRWADNARPKVRTREIDERGRAYGRGGRKTASARVWIYPGEGMISINRRDFVEYFPRESDREAILGPFVATRTAGYFDVRAHVEGGGLSGKAGAVRHGLARALERYNPEYRPAMKRLGFLTRDSRMVERKKVGKKKARKSPQWVRR